MRLLFVTRKYPPMVGGMEKLCYELGREFARRADLSLVAWGKSQRYLPYFLLSALLRSMLLIPLRRIEHVHLGDGLLAPLGLLLKLVWRRPVTATVYGLDVTFAFRPYQLVVPRCLARLDRLVCISQATVEECVRRGVPREKCAVIPPGIHPERDPPPRDKRRLGRLLGLDLDGKRVLVTVCRLVRRKGVLWFVREVAPSLPPDVVYLVIGDGPDRPLIERAIRARGLGGRVVLLGALGGEGLQSAYNGADLFVMPNVRVPGDVEGFGIVALEASAAGLPVVGSRLQGIQSAIIERRTGYLVEPESRDAFLDGIRRGLSGELGSPEAIRRAVEEAYGWAMLGDRYMGELCAVHSTPPDGL